MLIGIKLRSVCCFGLARSSSGSEHYVSDTNCRLPFFFSWLSSVLHAGVASSRLENYDSQVNSIVKVDCQLCNQDIVTAERVPGGATLVVTLRRS
jgi:hypothetical protein